MTFKNSSARDVFARPVRRLTTEEIRAVSGGEKDWNLEGGYKQRYSNDNHNRTFS